MEKLVRDAEFSIYPSEWYENCPFSVIESQLYGTPVLASEIGGIPELIVAGKTGDLFESRNKVDLKAKIQRLWSNNKLIKSYAENCRKNNFNNIEMYYKKIIKIYQNECN